MSVSTWSIPPSATAVHGCDLHVGALACFFLLPGAIANLHVFLLLPVRGSSVCAVSSPILDQCSCTVLGAAWNVGNRSDHAQRFTAIGLYNAFMVLFCILFLLQACVLLLSVLGYVQGEASGGTVPNKHSLGGPKYL